MHHSIISVTLLICLAAGGCADTATVPAARCSNDPQSAIAVDDVEAALLSLENAIVTTHPAPYARISEIEFKRRHQALRTAAKSGPTCIAAVAAWISQGLAATSDGHSRIDNSELARVWGTAAFRAAWVDGVLLLSAAESQLGHLVGAEIVAIGSKKTDDLAAELMKIVPHGTPEEFYRFSERYLYRTELLRYLGALDQSEVVPLTLVLTDGSSQRISVPAGGLSDDYTSVSDRRTTVSPLTENSDQFVWGRRVEESDLFYFRVAALLNQDGRPIIPAIFETFAAFDESGATRLLLDFRGNGGGNSVYGLPIVAQIASRPMINRPGGIYIATDKYTYSAAINATDLLLRRTAAIHIGEAPGGFRDHPGDYTTIKLQEFDLKVNISTREHGRLLLGALSQRLDPKIQAKVTVDDYRSGNDPVLRALTGHLTNQRQLRANEARSIIGRYGLDELTSAEVSAIDGRLWLKIGREIETPVFWSRTGHFETGVPGLWIMRSNDYDRLQLRTPLGDEVVLGRVNLAPRTPLEFMLGKQFEDGKKAFARLKSAQPDRYELSDSAMAMLANDVYFSLRAEGVARDEAVEIVRAILESSIEMNEDSPESEFVLSIYR